MAVASISQAILFKTPYLLNRTALVYIPFWGIFTGLLWLKIKTDFHSIPFQQAVLPLFLAVLGFLFLQNANLKEVQEWQFDKYTKQALSDILLDKKREKSPQKAKIGVFNYTHTAFYFYIQNDTALTKAIALPTHHEFLVRDTLFDYYYITNEVPAAEMVANYTPLKEYGGGYGVWKKKQ
jgi:hypothetical protein